MPYQLLQADRSGNEYLIANFPSFPPACEALIEQRKTHPPKDFHLRIINPDNIDIDWPDGLTDEEKENLP